MAKSKFKLNSDKVLSFTAMGISFITLVIFIYQTNLMSKQNYLSIMPYLSVRTTEDSAENIYEFRLQNNGVGPAIIESVTMIYGEERYKLSDYENKFSSFIQSKAPALDSLKNYWSATIDKGMAIPANTEYIFMRTNGSPEDFQLLKQEIEGLLSSGMDYEIIYKSIQDERWMIRNNAEGPKKLN